MTQEAYMEIVERYINSKANSWSDTTKAGARGHLQGLPPELVLKNDGEGLYTFLTKDKKEPLTPYSAKIYMVRVASFLDWAMESGVLDLGRNEVRLYMKHNARLFKRVYAPKRNGLSFEDTQERIKQIKDEDARKYASKLFRLGLRWEESHTLDEQGYVIGKGNAKRFIQAATPEDAHVKYEQSYSTFRNHLATVGLKPHDLRKAHATYLASNGANLGELMGMMGWTSVESASSYIQSVREQELVAALKKAIKKGEKKSGK